MIYSRKVTVKIKIFKEPLSGRQAFFKKLIFQLNPIFYAPPWVFPHMKKCFSLREIIQLLGTKISSFRPWPIFETHPIQ
ncbi:hypothetical protein D0X99_00735 [Algoriphagus lacus]|uniref:Uncharacterized protein n=1 Tax=Algoriphagus lacus TaxID=2056311 RepID=A0A418PW21_9BACT|nr:hypothetical protein D0X99_00735 [Algoriphagus lacus]